MGERREDMRVGEGSVFVTIVKMVDNAVVGVDDELTERRGGCKNESTTGDAGVASMRDMENAAARLYAGGARSDRRSRILGVMVEK